ncbi:MAG: hypothetical protein ABI678_28290, partial [Kofleriaceae bacterium]
SRRILVLEDEREARAALVAALAVHGHSCFVARDADELVASMALVQPDVVLYEWATRLESRLGLARRIRAAAAPRPLLVAILSHEPEPASFRDDEGVDAYFTQPVRLQALARALQR